MIPGQPARLIRFAGGDPGTSTLPNQFHNYMTIGPTSVSAKPGSRLTRLVVFHVNAFTEPARLTGPTKGQRATTFASNRGLAQ